MDEKNTIPDLRLGELTMELQGAQQNTGGASAKVPVKKITKNRYRIWFLLSLTFGLQTWPVPTSSNIPILNIPQLFCEIFVKHS